MKQNSVQNRQLRPGTPQERFWGYQATPGEQKRRNRSVKGLLNSITCEGRSSPHTPGHIPMELIPTEILQTIAEDPNRQLLGTQSERAKTLKDVRAELARRQTCTP